MELEIERKFRVNGDFRQDVSGSSRIRQGYLSSHPERAVRIRIRDNRGFLTVKGPGNESSMSRFEWETEIPLKDAEELLELCEPGRIDKIRHLALVGGHQFEIDEFFGDNAGLIIAEIELTAENEAFEKPEWLGEELTSDMKYYNAALVRNPYKNWKK